MSDFIIRQDASGRIQPTEGRYLWYPGYCSMCNRPPEKQDETFANLQVDIEQYGNLYLCLNCCAEVADFIGFVSPRIHNRVLGDLSAVQASLQDVEAQLAEAEGLLHARIRNAGNRNDDRKRVSNGSPSVDVLAAEPKSDIVNSVLNSD